MQVGIDRFSRIAARLPDGDVPVPGQLCKLRDFTGEAIDHARGEKWEGWEFLFAEAERSPAACWTIMQWASVEGGYGRHVLG